MNHRRLRILTAAICLPALAIGAVALAVDTPVSGHNAASASASGPGTPTSIDLISHTACSGGSKAKSNTITISNFTFQQCPDTVKPGTTITVHNKDSVAHTLTATSPAKAFNTGNIPGGATRHFKAPKKAGTYYYACSIHPFMLGTLVVS